MMNFLHDSNHEAINVSPPKACLTQEELEKQKFKADHDVTWFTQNEFVWRSGASIIWFLFLLPVVCILYFFMATLSLVHPVMWMADFFSKLFSFWEMSTFIIPIGIIMMPVVMMNINICSVEVIYGPTKISALISFFTYKHVHHLLLCISSACIAVWWMTSFTHLEYGMFIQNCTSFQEAKYTTCLNETSLFLTVFATILGFCYAISFFRKNQYQIKFPIVQQQRVFRMKSCLVPCFWQAFNICLKSLQIFYPSYFLFGFFSRNIVREITGLAVDRRDVPRDTLYGILDVRLFWYSFVMGTFITFLWTLANKLFVIFQTEVLRFPVLSSIAGQSQQSLPVVIKCQTVPLLKYLALNDLYQLSKFSVKRRKEILSLSIPGGRPLNWLWISEECLCLLNQLKERLVLANNGLVEKNSKNHKVTPPNKRDVDGVQSLSNGHSSPFSRHRVKQADTRADLTMKRDKMTDENWMQNKVLERIRQSHLLRFLLEKREDAGMEELFFDAQLQIWAAEGLSCLVAASFTEDVFGVVQKTLPFVLSLLLELLQEIEIYLKVPQGPRHLYKLRRPNEIRKTAIVLRNSLRCSIYRITKTFQRHLNDVELTSKNRSYLETFLNFEEIVVPK